MQQSYWNFIHMQDVDKVHSGDVEKQSYLHDNMQFLILIVVYCKRARQKKIQQQQPPPPPFFSFFYILQSSGLFLCTNSYPYNSDFTGFQSHIYHYLPMYQKVSHPHSSLYFSFNSKYLKKYIQHLKKEKKSSLFILYNDFYKNHSSIGTLPISTTPILNQCISFRLIFVYNVAT